MRSFVVMSLLMSSPVLSSPPNVFLVVSDDLGYNDVSMHGSEVRTPFLDSLALGDHGVHMANYYGHMICTPSRSSIVSG
jgi:arylsulfatase A-like enzyme